MGAESAGTEGRGCGFDGAGGLDGVAVFPIRESIRVRLDKQGCEVVMLSR
jgi:hypothetical protein